MTAAIVHSQVSKRYSVTHWSRLIFIAMLLVSDITSVIFASLLAEYCRELVRIYGWVDSPPMDTLYLVNLRYAVPYYCGMLIFMFLYVDLYKDRRLLSGSRELSQIARALAWLAVITVCVDFIFPHWMVFSRPSLILSTLFAFIFIATGRVLIHHYRTRLRRLGKDLRVAIIIGEGKVAMKLAQTLTGEKHHGYRVACMILPNPPAKRIDGIRLYSATDQFQRVLRRFPVDEVFLCYPDMNAADTIEWMQRIAKDCTCIHLVSHLFDRMVEKLHIPIDQIENTPILNYQQSRRKPWRDVIKRIIDFTASAALLVFLAPLILLLAIIVFLDSGFPILFTQRRVGQHQRQFNFYKFRTMHINAEAELDNLKSQNEINGMMFKIRNDPRITRSGKWMRKFSLDEIPQLINVLSGAMSLIGPRPPIPCETQQYDLWHQYRFTAPMGISGLWQVSGRNALDFEEMILLDIYYICNHSLLLDLRIMIRTIWVILQGNGH